MIRPSSILKSFTLFSLTLMALNLYGQKVGILMDSYVVERWANDEKYLCEKIKELGGEYQVEVAHGDAETQTTLAKKLINDGVKAIILIATDANKALEIVEICKNSKVPLIAYDRTVLSKDVSLCVSYNSRKVGNLQAEYALSRIQSGNFIVINGPVSDQNAIIYKEGQMDMLKPKIKNGSVKVIKDIVLDNWGELEAYMAMGDFVANNNEPINGIIAANDGAANGAISAMGEDAVKASKIYITGQDADLTAVVNIAKGTQGMTVYKPIKPLAYKAAEASMQLAMGKKVKGSKKQKFGDAKIRSILLNPIAVDKSNYKETVVKDGYIDLAEIQKALEH